MRERSRPQHGLFARLPDGAPLTRRAAAGLLAFAALAAPGAARAQERDSGRPGAFDFYVLALSWSPAFCADRGGERNARQCDPARRLGFVVHGLWPQRERGFPTECGGDRFVPRDAMAEAERVFPEPGLARYQWRRHGTCSGLSPSAYFRAAAEARAKVEIPEPLVAPDRDGETTALSIERAFAAVNPGLQPSMMSVQCRRGQLAEVRVCLTRDLRAFRPCPEVDRTATCRFGSIGVSAPR